MKKYEKLLKKKAEDIAKREALRADLKDLRGKQHDLEEEMDKAAEAEDLALYQAKKAELNDISDLISIKSKRLEKFTVKVDENEVRDAWSEYVKEYNKKFKDAWNEFLKQREALYASFKAVVIEQNEALKIRALLAEATGIIPDEYNGQTLDNEFKLMTIPDEAAKHNPSLLKTAEINYFVAFGCLEVSNDKDSDMTLMNQVIRCHVPYKGKVV